MSHAYRAKPRRRSSEASYKAAAGQAGQLGHLFEDGPGHPACADSSGGPPRSLRGKLARDLKRPLGPRNCDGKHNQFPRHPNTVQPPGGAGGRRCQDRDHLERGPRTISQEGHHKSKKGFRRLLKLSVPSTKSRRLLATSPELETTQQVCGIAALQDGVCSNSQEPGSTGRLVDLKDAYLTVPMRSPHQKYLRFLWKQELWQFRVLPFGLSTAPYTFTKLMKPVVSCLRRLGTRMILYLDDMLIMHQSRELLLEQLAAALRLLTALGFLINLKKSVLTLSNQMEFLGFHIDSTKMVISLPQPKMHSLTKLAKNMGVQATVSLRDLAQILGTMVAAHPAVLPAPLHYRCLERTKSVALRKGLPYDAQVEVSQEMKEELRWWTSKASQYNGRPIEIPQWDMIIESDASKLGWGACTQDVQTGGPWTLQEQHHSINYLELLASFLGLQTFASSKRKTAVLLRLDNVTAIAYLNKMGGPHSPTLSRLAVRIWEWCIRKEMIIHAEHLPGKENVRADWESRHISDCSDWMLDRAMFEVLDQNYGPFSMDLFASRDEPSASHLWQLETRPDGMGSGCTLSPVGRAQPLHVSPICPNSPLPQQTRGRERVSSADCTGVAEPGVVSTVAAVVGIFVFIIPK